MEAPATDPLEPTGKAFAATAACTTLIRLAATRRRHNRPRYRPHHAPTDALASAELLQAQIAHRIGPDGPLAELWK